jgi:hypothetical protein
LTEYVLDASALIALVNKERGADKVRPLMPHAVMCAVNYCETIQRLRFRRRGHSAATGRKGTDLQGGWPATPWRMPPRFPRSARCCASWSRLKIEPAPARIENLFVFFLHQGGTVVLIQLPITNKGRSSGAAPDA